jgi:hypothetical protein
MLSAAALCRVREFGDAGGRKDAPSACQVRREGAAVSVQYCSALKSWHDPRLRVERDQIVPGRRPAARVCFRTERLAASRRKASPVRSKPSRGKQDDDDDQDDADEADTAVTVAVTVAADAATEASEQSRASSLLARHSSLRPPAPSACVVKTVLGLFARNDASTRRTGVGIDVTDVITGEETGVSGGTTGATEVLVSS